MVKDKSLGGLGLRHSGKANIVSLAKFNWHFIREEDSLWAKVLRGKYVNPANSHYRPSFLGRSLCKGCPLADFYMWNSNSGVFCPKVAYNLATFPSPTEPISNLSWVWKINAHPRVVYFIWLALQNGIASKEFLFLRHLIPDQACPHCQNPIENSMHMLHLCLLAQSFWKGFGVLPGFFDSNLSFVDWVHLSCHNKKLNSSG